MKKDVETAIACHDMIHDARLDMIKDAKRLDPMVTIDNVIACRRHFEIVDFWNYQLRRAMGWR